MKATITTVYFCGARNHFLLTSLCECVSGISAVSGREPSDPSPSCGRSRRVAVLRTAILAVSSGPLAVASAKTVHSYLWLYIAKSHVLSAMFLLLRVSTKPSAISKITRPVFAGILPRLRLFRLVDKCLRGGVSWVGGPPGSGKTSLVSSYVSHLRRPCLWYRVDAGEPDAPTSFRSLQLAADEYARRNRKRPVRLIPESPPNPEAFSQRFGENLFRLLSPGGLLVIDNVPASGGSGVHPMLWDSLACAPRDVSVVMIGRGHPPPSFARIRAPGAGGSLGWNDLRLTREESRAIVESRGGRKLPQGCADRLYARSDGWVAGLVLLLEGDNASRVENQWISRSAQEEIFQYFGSEVFERLGEEMRVFLMATAFLPDLTARTAIAVTGNPATARILADLCRHGHFTEKRAGDTPTFRYHSLFREFLIKRAEELLFPEELLRIRRRAAAVLEESGRAEDAAVILRGMGDWEGLGRIVREQARQLGAQGRMRTLAKWIHSLPEEVSRNDPWLLYWNGVCHLGVTPKTSTACFERALAMFEAGGNAEGALRSWAGLVDSILFEWDDYTRLDHWIDWLDRRLADGLAFPSPESEARVATAMLGAMVFRRPKTPDVEHWTERALSVSRDAGNGAEILQARIYVAIYRLLTGNRAGAAVALEEGRRLAEVEKTSPVLFHIWKCLAAIVSYCGDGDCDIARRSLSEGSRAIRRSGVRLCGHLFPGAAAICFLMVRNVGKAALSLREMESTLAPPRRAASAMYEYLCAWHHLLKGDHARAAAHTDEALAQAVKSGIPFLEILCRLAAAHVAMDKGRQGEAASRISEARALIHGTGNKMLLFMAHLADARMRIDGRETDAALSALREAFSLGRNQGYVHNCWWWQPAVMTRLCLAALDAGIETDYARLLIVANDLIPEAPPVETEEWPWPLKVYTLGRFALVREGKAVHSSGRAQQKPLQMLKALIALGGRGVHEEQIVDVLWPDTDGDLAHQSFATTLRRLRRLLGKEKAILLREGRLTLNGRYCWVDAWAFERLLGRAESGWGEGGGVGPAVLVERSIAFYQGPFLAGETFCHRLVSVRERLRSKFLRCVEAAGRSCEDAGDYRRAVAFYRKGLEVDALAEELYRCLIGCLRKMGEDAEALRVYNRCREVLGSVLGVKPSRSTEEEAKYLINI